MKSKRKDTVFSFCSSEDGSCKDESLLDSGIYFLIRIQRVWNAQLQTDENFVFQNYFLVS